jgi:hypothetical protein
MTNSTDSFLRYLTIPQNYGPTKGLVWSNQGDSIITWAGQIFAFAEQVALFLEGFASQRSLPHFGYILDLLRLLGHGDSPLGWTAIPKSIAIRKAYRDSGPSARNAGAFLAVLCEELPHATQLPPENVGQWLSQTPYRTALCAPRDNHEIMPWDADRFHRFIGEQLENYSEHELHYWLKQAHAPVEDEGESIARELVAVKPPPRQGSLETLLKERTRLHGAIPLVNAMVSALSLPPRRQTPPQMPLGGYADVTTRGEPERLLLSQLALDPDEFVRRFAEKELLYFRREEPQERTRENLVLLVDQGVRTWGTARLALSAAVVAFSRIAAKKKLPFHIRFGSKISERIDPMSFDIDKLGDLLEASDLSATPAELLEAEIGQQDCDVVVLTHPRSLLESSVKSAAGKLAEQSRLFSLTTEEEGHVEFSEIRKGEALCISRFRVDFSRTYTKPIPPFVPSGEMWRGDIEPIPFPFPFGLTSDSVVGIAFDAQATRLLVATAQPMLHVWNIKNGAVEALPRPVIDGKLATMTHFMGVEEGFVVAGKIQDQLFAVHYDFRSRNAKLHRLGKSNGQNTRWYAFPDLHAIAVREDFVCRGVDLQTGAQYAEPEIRDNSSVRAHMAYVKALDTHQPIPEIDVRVIQSSDTASYDHFAVYHHPQSGVLSLGTGPKHQVWQPEIEGQPFLRGIRIEQAQFANGILALKYQRKGSYVWQWCVVRFDRDPISFIGSELRSDGHFLLAPDGKKYAIQSKRGRIKIVDMATSETFMTTARAGVKATTNAFIGKHRLIFVEGKRLIEFNWKEGDLEVTIRRSNPDATLEPEFVPARAQGHPATGYDSWRFTAVASKSLDVIIDRANHLIVYDPHRSRLVCIFWVRGGRWVVWMPDGTRFGPRDLLGGSSTPGALARVGEALRQPSRL